MDELDHVFDDFFMIGNVGIFHHKTNNASYDFAFRQYFSCHAIFKALKCPVLLHIGDIKNYDEIEDALASVGIHLLISNEEHCKCSYIDEWYPLLKDHTPFTMIYDSLPSLEELQKDFTFPIFVKGTHKTNHHKKALCIIENEAAYERLCTKWEYDRVLSMQKVAIRTYVPLEVVDAVKYPDLVPMSYEFRFFYYAGKCMGYGPYWYPMQYYRLADEEYETVKALADWAVEQLGMGFYAIDVAKTQEGKWIIIEVNDGQESNFDGVNPYSLWSNIIVNMQDNSAQPSD